MNRSRSTVWLSRGRPGAAWVAALVIFSVAPAWAAPAPGAPARPTSQAGSVSVRGNTDTSADFIRRTIELAPGTTWTPERAAEARRLLTNTRLFYDVGVRPSGNAVQVDVKERWSLGLYPNITKDGDRLTYGLGVEETNLGGQGRRLGIRGWGGDGGDGGQVWFAEPWVFGRNIFMDASLSGGRWFDRFFDVDGSLLAENEISYVSGALNVGTRLDNHFQIWGGLLIRSEDLTQLQGNILTETGRFDVLRAGAVYDATSFEISWIEGWRAWVEVDQGTDLFGGDFRYRALGAGAAWFHRPWRDHLVFVTGEAWHSTNLPFREFFSLGGQDTLRGYLVGEFRGSREVRGSAEYQVPFWHPQAFGYHVDVAGATFVDWGLLWSEGEGIALRDSLLGAGVGLRVATQEIPYAGLRVDLGYGFETRSWEGYFSFGPAF